LSASGARTVWAGPCRMVGVVGFGMLIGDRLRCCGDERAGEVVSCDVGGVGAGRRGGSRGSRRVGPAWMWAAARWLGSGPCAVPRRSGGRQAAHLTRGRLVVGLGSCVLFRSAAAWVLRWFPEQWCGSRCCSRPCGSSRCQRGCLVRVLVDGLVGVGAHLGLGWLVPLIMVMARRGTALCCARLCRCGSRASYGHGVWASWARTASAGQVRRAVRARGGGWVRGSVSGQAPVVWGAVGEGC
jgi:hypothetical protein